MQQPGVSRAILMGIIGFIIGALVTLLLRGLQGLTPVWEPGIGLVLATFLCAGFFVWGIGAFDPKLSLHGEAAEAAAAEAASKEPTPMLLLSSSMWQILGLLLGLFVVLFFVSSIWGGLTLVITADPVASATHVGMQPVVIADLAHLFLLLLTPPILLGFILLLVTLAWLLFLGPLKPKRGHFLGNLVRFALLLAIPGNLFIAYVQFGIVVPQSAITIATLIWALILYFGPFRPSEPGGFAVTWRIVVMFAALLAVQLIIPLWFDNVAPFRQLPFPYVLVTIDRPISENLFDWLNASLTTFFQADTIYISQLVIFIGLILFALITMVIVAGGLGLLFFALSRGLAISKAEAAAAAALAKTAPAEKQPAPPIGRLIGRSAGWLAKTLRKAPNVLQG